MKDRTHGYTPSTGVGAQMGPVRKRITELDALRGFAILGIALANFPEFSLWTFLDSGTQAALPRSGADPVVRFLQYLLVDGKFYTIFSILFGIGFSITIANARKRGADGMKIFYRRMGGLTLIGLIHLLFVWNGDILLLYALLGMLLPLFYRCKPGTLLKWSAAFLLLPIVISALRVLTGVDPSVPLYDAWWKEAGAVGINEGNFATWLRDASTYSQMFRFLRQGAIERMWEFVSGMRYFKVLGLFLFGFWIGRNKVHERLGEFRLAFRKVGAVCLAVGLPLSVAYAWIGTHGGNPVLKETVYAFSVYPLAVSYMCGLLLLIAGKGRETLAGRLSVSLAAPGKMALTSYLSQSVIGIILFYGIGFGLGASMTLWETELVALAVFVLEVILSGLWLRRFAFGPVEWVWRMWTYGKYFPLRKGRE